MTRATSSIVTSSIGEHDLIRSTSVVSSAVDTNCTHDILFKDTFFLTIHNFTTDKDGYYWCQIVINDLYLQPSPYAWFYAANRSSCTPELHFMTASESEIQCAENYTINSYATATTSSYESATVIVPSRTNSTPLTNTLPTTSVPMVIDPKAYSSSVTNSSALIPSESDPITTMVILRMTESVIYVAGAFSMLLILLAALVITLILLHIHRSRRKKDQSNGESMDMFIFKCCDFKHIYIHVHTLYRSKRN